MKRPSMHRHLLIKRLVFVVPLIRFSNIILGIFGPQRLRNAVLIVPECIIYGEFVHGDLFLLFAGDAGNGNIFLAEGNFPFLEAGLDGHFLGQKTGVFFILVALPGHILVCFLLYGLIDGRFFCVAFSGHLV